LRKGESGEAKKSVRHRNKEKVGKNHQPHTLVMIKRSTNVVEVEREIEKRERRKVGQIK